MELLLLMWLVCGVLGALINQAKNRSPLTGGLVGLLLSVLGLFILACQRKLVEGEVEPTGISRPIKIFAATAGVLVAGVIMLALLVPADGNAAPPIVPSKTRAAYVVKVDLADKYPIFVTTPATAKMKRPPANASVSCQPLTDQLYRCTYYAKDPLFYTVVGKAKVRFYKYAADVVLYDSACYNAGLYVDFCRS